MATNHEAMQAMIGSFYAFLMEREEEEASKGASRQDYLLCDEVWEILDEAGHGCVITITQIGKQSEVLYYDQFAKQWDNVRFMEHICTAIDEGATVNVNGKDIFDLY